MLVAERGRSEIQKPLATVVVGGLVTSTLLTLLIIPSVYGWFEKRKVEDAEGHDNGKHQSTRVQMAYNCAGG